MWLFYYFNFEKNYSVLKSKSSCILLNKNINLMKTERNQKWKILRKILEGQNLCSSSYENRKSKVKLWWVEPYERKKRAFVKPFVLSDGIFSNICVLSQFIVQWIHFQNIHTFTYQKTLVHTLLFLVFKIVEILQSILNFIVITFCSIFKGVVKNHKITAYITSLVTAADWTNN